MTAGRTAIGNSLDWCTPIKYVDSVRKVLGKIALDPCSNVFSQVNAEVELQLPTDDGLHTKWDYDTIFVNPPYGSDKARGTRIIDWLRKCADANNEFGSEVIALIPVAGNTKQWKEYVWPKAESICFLYDTRLKFLVDGKNDGKGAPMACSVVYWGKNPRKFASVFRDHGAVVSLSNVSLPYTPNGNGKVA